MQLLSWSKTQREKTMISVDKQVFKSSSVVGWRGTTDQYRSEKWILYATVQWHNRLSQLAWDHPPCRVVYLGGIAESDNAAYCYLGHKIVTSYRSVVSVSVTRAAGLLKPLGRMICHLAGTRAWSQLTLHFKQGPRYRTGSGDLRSESQLAADARLWPN